jgi:disulfide bond formation protein DsbB
MMRLEMDAMKEIHTCSPCVKQRFIILVVVITELAICIEETKLQLWGCIFW